jgi:hypothetical protein
MKKHIAGFILFCFVVGTAVFVSRLFGVSLIYKVTPNHDKIVPLKEKTVIAETDAEFGAIDKNSPRVRQAVFSLTTKQVNLELLFNKKQFFDEGVAIKFNFFRNNEQGIRFIHSEIVRLVPDSFSYSNGDTTTASVIGSYNWLDELGSYDNLYVVAEFTNSYTIEKTNPKFDANFAKEVLLSKGNIYNVKYVDR